MGEAGYVWGAWCVRGCGVYGRGVGGGGGGCGYACGVWAEPEEGETATARPRTMQCVCVCVYGGAGGVCGVFGPGAYGLGVCVRVCACACACARARARVRGGGGGAPGCVCVCTRWVQAGCVCGYACGVFLWVVRAETEAESRSQAKDDAVGVWYGHGVCVWGGGWSACGVCGGRAETDPVRQRITCMDGYPASSACVF